MYAKINYVWNEIIKERMPNHVFIYPYGEMGMKLQEILSKRYSYTNVTCIDKGLSLFNPKIKPVEYLKEVDWTDGNKVLVITSENKEIFQEIRCLATKYVPNEYIYDCNKFSPYCEDEDQRVVAMALAAREIYISGIEGAVAEAGVYRGEFAQHINKCFPDRKLYLFDSFSGFDEVTVEENFDNKKQTDGWINTLKDTSVEQVMNRMRYKDNVIIRKGYVPDTLFGIEDTFAFVNLDMDIYFPTYEALKFFWPRMNKGGYIFVHDFDFWDGIRKAVSQFCEEYHVGYFWLNDKQTIAIVKPL